MGLWVHTWGVVGGMVVAGYWTSMPPPRLPGPLRLELRKGVVYEEDLLSVEGVLVPGWLERERGPVSTSGTGAWPIRGDTSQNQGFTVAIGCSLNRRSFGTSLQPSSSSRKEGMEGMEQATLMGLHDMMSRAQRVKGATSVLCRPAAGRAGGHRRGGGGLLVIDT